MNQFYSVIFAAFLGLLHSSTHAQEMYKWTDANGTVHYSDRATAPEGSKKMNITVSQPSQPLVVPAPTFGSQPRLPLLQHRDEQKKSVPVNPARVGADCKGLIEKIAAVPAGKNWELLYRKFDSVCPGIAYECKEYESRPQNNQCTWIERSGSNVLSRNKYP